MIVLVWRLQLGRVIRGLDMQAYMFACVYCCVGTVCTLAKRNSHSARLIRHARDSRIRMLMESERARNVYSVCIIVCVLCVCASERESRIPSAAGCMRLEN